MRSREVLNEGSRPSARDEVPSVTAAVTHLDVFSCDPPGLRRARILLRLVFDQTDHYPHNVHQVPRPVKRPTLDVPVLNGVERGPVNSHSGSVPCSDPTARPICVR